MTDKDNGLMLGQSPMPPFFNWWRPGNAPATDDITTQLKRVETFVADLQQSYGEACSHQMEALLATNETLMASVQDLARCREPGDFFAAQSNILLALMEGVSGQAKVWSELAEQVKNSCTTTAQDMAEQSANSAREAAPSTSPIAVVRQVSKPVGKRAVHA